MSLRLYSLVFIFAAVLFTIFPQIDLIVAAKFWQPSKGFFLGETTVPWFLYKFIPFIAYGVGLFVVTVFILRFFKCKFSFGINSKEALFLLLAIIIAPGLVANTILKDHWGRARPSQIEQFGGKAQFTPVLLPTNQCENNCSFVAGHPSMAFYTIAFAFLIADMRRRRIAQTGAILFGCLAGFGRIAQGGHFLSDVVFSGIITCGVVWLLYYLIVEQDIFSKSNPVWNIFRRQVA